MDPLFNLLPDLSATPPRGLQRALYQQLRDAIIAGRLANGLRLPSSRALATQLAISRNTVVAVYDQLIGQGYLFARRGGGCFVAERALLPPAPSAAKRDARISAFWRDAAEPTASEESVPVRYDFSPGLPDTQAFPQATWRRLSARAQRLVPAGARAYAAAAGAPALRAAIAQHVSFARAVACRADDVLVTAGAQQAFDLLARVLVTAGQTRVAFEEPAYPPARLAFQAAGAILVPVPVDAEGLRVDLLPADVQVVCVTPSHQFPLGCTLSAARRVQLLAFARARGAVLIEDDYDGEFRFHGKPLDALQTQDRAQSVCYVGTFSKSMFPALRLGFVVLPPWLRAAMLAAKQAQDWACPSVPQEALASFIAEGHLARHVRRMRLTYRRRHDLLLDALKRHCAEWLHAAPADCGLHVAAALAPGLKAAEVAAHAAQAGILLRTLTRSYLQQPAPQGLLLGFGCLTETQVEAACAALGAVLHQLAAQAGGKHS